MFSILAFLFIFPIITVLLPRLSLPNSNSTCPKVFSPFLKLSSFAFSFFPPSYSHLLQVSCIPYIPSLGGVGQTRCSLPSTDNISLLSTVNNYNLIRYIGTAQISITNCIIYTGLDLQSTLCSNFTGQIN